MHTSRICALGRRAGRREVVPPLVRLGELACALRDVEDDRRSSARELIGEVSATAGQLLHDVIRDDQRVEGVLVDVEALMIESHFLIFVRERERERARTACAGFAPSRPHQ